MALKINGVGTLTRDAVIQTETSTGCFLSIGLATKRKVSKEGKQDVDFFEASYLMKNKNSPLLGYLKKGTTIYLDSAEMRADMYEKDGSNKVFNKIMIFSFDFINGRKENTSKEITNSYDEDASKNKEPEDNDKKPIEPPIIVPKKDKNTEDSEYEDEVPF